jgi:two-component system, LytTR family, sensor kinase
VSATRPTGRWVRAGIAGWAAVACVWALDVGLQLRAGGFPVWWAMPNTLLAIAPGIALTPVVFLGFRRLLTEPRPLLARGLVYAGIGIVFWLLWSVMVFGLGLTGIFYGTLDDLGRGTLLFRQVAGFSFNSLILYSVMVMLYEAVRHVREAQRQELRASRLQAELARARTAALQAQLNPHFLFNTLHVASGLSSTDVAGARQVLADLGDLLRGSLRDSGEQLVPLRDEIGLVARYVGIQKARFRDRLQVELDIDPDTRRLGVPPLLLQPLVENAVIHGVSGHEEGGVIRVSATREGERLCLAVVDSGGGFAGGGTIPARERVGIGGTRSRLRLLFGDDAALRFSYPATGGFRVEVALPAIPMPVRDEQAASAVALESGAP